MLPLHLHRRSNHGLMATFEMTIPPGSSPNAALSRSDQWHAVTASFLGWTLDAFDFFVIVFLIDTLAVQFHVPKSAIVATIGYTLAMRPVGAVFFGLLADRYGRRKLLMANVVFFSVVELLCGFAPNYTVFLLLRTIYGIGMGGEWGVGASLAMESAPTKWRGILSGVVQSGYSIGYLMAALAARFVQPAWGWRAMFWVGGVPALLAFTFGGRVRESEAWHQHRAPTMGAICVGQHTGRVFLSGPADDAHDVSLARYTGSISRLLEIGARIHAGGCLLHCDSVQCWRCAGRHHFGYISERLGRRRSMIAALAVSLAVIPAWAFGGSLAVLAMGAFVMQVGVQGAWGIIPAHLNELSPDAARGLMPGLAYQLGVLFAAGTNTIEYALRDRLGYAWALAAFEITNIALLMTVIGLGSERKGKEFLADGKVQAPALSLRSRF